MKKRKAYRRGAGLAHTASVSIASAPVHIAVGFHCQSIGAPLMLQMQAVAALRCAVVAVPGATQCA